MLAVEGLTVRRGHREVLRGASLSLADGELVILVGPNGSGKSTLLSTLVGALPHSGTIIVEGRPLDALSDRARARAFALVPQDTEVPFDLTVGEVAALGRLPHLGPFAGASAEDRDAVDAALRDVDLLALADVPVRFLSGGERARVHLARAFAQEARVLLLDEPIAHLDLAHRLAMLERTRRHVGPGRSALVVLHDLDLAVRFGDRVLVMDGGLVVADGPPESVLSEQRLAETFRVRARVERDGRGLPRLSVDGGVLPGGAARVAPAPASAPAADLGGAASPDERPRVEAPRATGPEPGQAP